MDKQAKENCEICKKKYGGVFSNEHQCKRCLRSICRQCCTRKKAMFTKANTKIQQHRCCDICLPESQSIANYIKQHFLTFNTLSKEGKQWSELAEIDLMDQQHKPRSRPLKSKLQPVFFLDAWAQMTPSLRDLSGSLITKVSVGNIDSSLKTICQKINNPSNVDLTIGLIIYLLCHCDEKSAVKIYNYLQGIAHNISEKEIVSYLEILCLKGQTIVDSKTTKILLNFAKNIYKSFILCFFVNCLTIDIVHFLVLETLLSGDGQILELTTSCIIYQFRTYILSDKYDQKGLKNLIWMSVTLKNLQRSIKRLRKVSVKQKGSTNDQQIDRKQSRSIASLKLSQIEKANRNSEIPKQQEDEMAKVNFQKMAEKEEADKKMEAQNIEVLTKLKEAAEFMKKIEEQQIKEDVDLNDMESLEKYLDLVIEQNDKSLQQFSHLENMLAAIEQKLQLPN